MPDGSRPDIGRPVPFFMVADMQAALKFYVEGLGFRVANTWEPSGFIEWCWLDRGGVALMLQQYREGRLPEERRGVGVSICFQCEDALALYREFVAKGLEPRRPFVGNRMWDVAIADPDGYSLHFESPTEVPEETEYDPAVHG